MKTKLIIALLFLLTALSSVKADSKLVCNLYPREDDQKLRHIWLLFTKKGQKDYHYISIEGRAYDGIPDWAKRIRSIIDSKAHKITFIVPTTTKQMEGVLWCTGKINRNIRLTLRVAPKTNTTIVP